MLSAYAQAARERFFRRDGGGPGAAGQPAARVWADRVAAPWEERARLLRPEVPGDAAVPREHACGHVRQVWRLCILPRGCLLGCPGGVLSRGVC
jgi:hypothetical protein